MNSGNVAIYRRGSVWDCEVNRADVEITTAQYPAKSHVGKGMKSVDVRADGSRTRGECRKTRTKDDACNARQWE